MPRLPTSIDASSLKMSPNILPHTIVSNCFGHLTNCIAALSTYMCDSSTPLPALPVHANHDVLPELRHVQDIRLVDGAAPPLPFLGHVHGDAGDALDLGLRVNHIVLAPSHTSIIGVDARGLAKIHISAQLAHDHDVHAFYHLSFE